MSSHIIQRGGPRLVFGLGITGASVARYCIRHAIPLHVVDSRAVPDQLEAIKAYALEQKVELQITTGVDFETLIEDRPELNTFIQRFDQVFISPGVNLSHPLLEAAREFEVPIDNDIGLFVRTLRQAMPSIKIVAITGSNGKSTVTDALAYVGNRLGLRCHALGNIGNPVLDMLDELTHHDTVVLELSSYQLESVAELGADVATLLNVSEDHLDRHGTMQNYWQAKQKVYQQAKAVVVNKDDPLSSPLEPHKNSGALEVYVRFGLGVPDLNDFGLIQRNNKHYLAEGIHPLIAIDELALQGPHNHANFLAVLAIAKTLGWALNKTCEALKDYRGLAYRCAIEKTDDQVTWMNDSKGTNVGASLVALKSGAGCVALDGGLWWIAGGLSKGAQFQDIATYLESLHEINTLKGCLLYGQDKHLIQASLLEKGIESIQICETLKEAVSIIKKSSRPGDIVVFSPACASMDQFKNFEARGRAFSEYIKE